jgi:hypothetical protein
MPNPEWFRSRLKNLPGLMLVHKRQRGAYHVCRSVTASDIGSDSGVFARLSFRMRRYGADSTKWDVQVSFASYTQL